MQNYPPSSLTPPPPNSTRTSGLAIWSLVLGIVGLLCLPLIPAIIAVICGHKALSAVRRSQGMLTGRGLAIAGLVTGYIGLVASVVLVIAALGFFGAVAIPNFARAKDLAQKNACINNLRRIDGAKQQWALENKRADTDIPTWADITVFIKNDTAPTCPAGGFYTIGAVNADATCSKSAEGHTLPSP